MTAPPPWGALAPNALERAILAVTRAAPRRGLARAPASALRNLMTLWRPGPVDAEIYGFKARLHHRENLSDKRALFHPDHWESEERRLLEVEIGPRFRFIDIGANTGLYSLFVAARAGAGATILAVEPQPEVAAWLRFNIDANGYTTIRHVDAAVAAGPGRVALTLPEGNRGSASIARTGARTVEVTTLAILDLMDRHGLEKADAIKIDIEGAEDQALAPFFAACPPQRLPARIFMESLEDSPAAKCIELARRAGYVVGARTARNTMLALGAGGATSAGG
jgi:FkbM family methyltransferase